MFLMIDNYDSFTYNLYALFCQCNAEVKIIKNSEFVPADDFDGIIISPGPSTPENSGTSLKYLEKYLGQKPVLGVCLGMQCIAHSMGYKIVQAKTIKHGKVDKIRKVKKSILLDHLPEEFNAVRYHSLAADVDEEFVTALSLDDGVVMVIENKDKKIFGLQFHPESISGEYGREIINNFLDFVYNRSMDMDRLIQRVNSGEKLNFEESLYFFEGMAGGALTEAQMGSSLISMKLRGETVNELAGLVSVMDKHKKRFHHNSEKTVDTCGTGGDGKSTVNVSTAVSLIMASMGYNVVKHGNTAQTGKVGSADILKEIGLDISYSKKSAEDFYKDNNFVFLFAQHHHPALKPIGKVRRELKVPTIFNFVGPLVNPADPDYQVIGISRRDKLDFFAESISKLGRNNVTVYSSCDGYDEISSNDRTECIHIKDGKRIRFMIDPADFFEPFGMPRVKDKETAAELFWGGLYGGIENIVLLFSLNAALVLYTVDGTDLKEGFAMVKDHILRGSVREKIESMLKD